MNQKDQINQTDQIDSRSWFVIQTKPANEARVEKNLLNQQINVFLPGYAVYQCSGGRVVQQIRPLFPSYIFARLDLDLHYYKVKWTRGVNKILGNGVGPLPVSDRVIETIRERVGEDNLVKLEDGWKEGDLVRISSGPFRDLIGVFQKQMSDKGRVLILLNLIGADVSVQISKWQIKKVA